MGAHIQFQDPRLELFFNPRFQGWTVSYAKREAWRLHRCGDVDDLVQEGFVVFSKILRTYPHVQDPAHLMALYKTALYRHVCNLTKPKSVVCEELSEEHWAELPNVVGVDDVVFLSELLKAPVEVLRVLKRILMTPPAELGLQRVRLSPAGRGRRLLRESSRRRWIRVLGDDAQYVMKLKKFLQSVSTMRLS